MNRIDTELWLVANGWKMTYQSYAYTAWERGIPGQMIFIDTEPSGVEYFTPDRNGRIGYNAATEKRLQALTLTDPVSRR